MTATSADVISFKANVPEFKSLPDADIGAALDETDVWLDEDMWSPKDFPLARRLLTAHNLKMAQFYSVPAGGSGVASVGAGSSDLFVRSISFGERSVSFDRRLLRPANSSTKYGAGQASLEDTIYGQRYLRLLNRNVPGVMTV